MLITCLRKAADRSKLTASEMSHLVNHLRLSMRSAGFITEVEQKTSTSIKIGLHMKCFVVDTEQLGQNARRCRFQSETLTGWKRTNLPTWDQRVSFNEIVNDVLTIRGLSANVKSGAFTIRKGEHCFDEYDWRHEVPAQWQENAWRFGFDVTEEVFQLDADDEAEEKRLKAEKRREQAARRKAEAAKAPKLPELTIVRLEAQA